MAVLKLSTLGVRFRFSFPCKARALSPTALLTESRDREADADDVKLKSAHPSLEERKRVLPLARPSHASTAALNDHVGLDLTRVHFLEDRSARGHWPPFPHAEMAALNEMTSGSTLSILHLLEDASRAPAALPARRDGCVERDDVGLDTSCLHLLQQGQRVKPAGLFARRDGRAVRVNVGFARSSICVRASARAPTARTSRTR